MKRLFAALTISFCLVFQMACGAGTLSKLHDTLNKVAKSLNAAAKTNRGLYEGGIYGVTGSPGAIELRQKGATVIHGANEKLIVALTLAQGLTAETFETGKLGVLQALSQAAIMLKTGNQTMDLVLQSVAVLINQAVLLIQAWQASHLPYVLPEIRTWRIQEVTA